MRFLFSVGSLLDRLCVVVGAFIGSQFPAFMQQYSQRLGGHVEELRQLLDHLRHTASLSNKTLEQYIQKFISSADPDFNGQGEFMQQMVHRWEELNAAFVNLTQSSLWVRPFAFVKDLQHDIAHSTFAAFQPGFNLNVEGFCYVGIGMIFGWGFYQLTSKCFMLGFSRLKWCGV